MHRCAVLAQTVVFETLVWSAYRIPQGNYRSWGGLIAGVLISVLVLFLSYELIRRGYRLEGIALAVIDLRTLAGVCVSGTRSRRDEKAGIMAWVRGGRREQPALELPQ